MSSVPIADLAARHGIRIPADQQGDWATLLQTLDASVQRISAMDDYLPALDLQKYPRTDAYVPADTVDGGWAVRVREQGADRGPGGWIANTIEGIVHGAINRAGLDQASGSDGGFEGVLARCPIPATPALFH